MAQVNDNDDIKWLYGKLKAKGYNIGSEAEFKSSLANGEDRKWYYEKAKGMGLDMGSMADFESMYAPKSAPSKGTTVSHVAPNQPQETVVPTLEAPKPKAPSKPHGTPMTEAERLSMGYRVGQMVKNAQQGVRNTKAKVGRMLEPTTQKGRERRRLGEFQARVAGTPTHVVGVNFATPEQAAEGGVSVSQGKPVPSEQSPQPYGVEYENGKAKTQWMLPDGTLTTSLTEANQAEYNARTARLAHLFHDRMKENGLDPNKPEDVQKQALLDYEAPMREAIENEWQRAEAEDRADDERYRKELERSKGVGIMDPNGFSMRSGDEYISDVRRAAKRQDTFNLEKMAQSVLENMPDDYKDNQILNYSRYFREHPGELNGRTVSQAAKDALLGEVYHATYERAVKAKMPRSKTDFLLRKIADQPFFSQSMSDNMAARLFSHSIGTEAAEMDAMSRYGSEHRALDITGTVVNMGIDPTTYLSGGFGSFMGKQALKTGAKYMLKGATKEAAERYVGRTLTGRMISGVAAGAGNFGAFEGIKNMQQQMRLGGTLNPETGEYEYSAGDVLKATEHGMLLGSVTGTLSPILGNVSDKLVKATQSTAGKMGIRAGELMTSTVAEGTVFATPEWIENAQLADNDLNKRKAMDIWTDNMAMMLGFKASHGIKSAPKVIAGLRPIADPKTMEERNHNRMSFEERLRKRMDASPRDLDFTKEEREELQRNGYGDLASFFTRTPKQPTKPKGKPTMTDGKTMTFDVDFQHAEAERVSNPEFDGYEAMERLMQDPNVSQSARAKAYYILTGRMLPMGTITGYITNKDAKGVTVQAVTAQGEVVTTRHFKTEAEAETEQANIMRQAELNSVDVGERYKEAAANAKVAQAAVESVAPGADFATVMRNYRAVKEGDKDAIATYGKMVEDIDRAIEDNKGMADSERPEAIRASIKDATGVDIDETLRKEPRMRTEEEQAAVEDYIKRLFPEQKGEEAGANSEAEQPMSEEESAAADAYDQAHLLWGKVEKGDTDAKAEVDAIVLRMQEAYQMCEDAFGTDAEVRIAEMNEDPWALMNNPELTEDQKETVLYYVNAKAALDGVKDASNESAESKRNEVAVNVERHTHKDNGMVQPATMKMDDKPVYIVKGNVVPLPDGSGVDVRNSDQSIVICDAETGEYKFASPDQIFSVGEAIDPQTEIDEAFANIQAEHEAVLGVGDVSQVSEEQNRAFAQNVFNNELERNGITLPYEQVEQMQQYNQQMYDEAQQRKTEENKYEPTALDRVPLNPDTQEPMFEKVDRETALDALNEVTGGNEENTAAIVNAQLEQATKTLEALKKKAPTKKAPALKGSPMAMVKAQQEAEANYNTAMEEYNVQVAAAEDNLNAWKRINSLMNDRKRAVREQQEAEQRERDKQLHDEAVARLEEDKRIAAEKAAEQAAVGTHAVNPKIKAKWDGATKVEGNPNAITLADGSTIRGHYVLTEAGAATASHDVNNAYEPTEGFPVDENGESVNDRDYKRDKDAQRIVRDIADNYDNRALQTPVIVSKDGVVLSGNNRTMSGEIAAKNGTDKAYVDHLREFGGMFGFTPEQIDGMQHPRVVFVPDEDLPYDASTFARFNAEQQKKQSKPEPAVKLGKIVPDNVFTSITNDISRFDRMSDYYANEEAVASAISQLLDAGVINEMQLPEFRTGNALSAAGKELIENTLIGKVFQTSPDAVRQIIGTPTLRHSVVMGLNEIANNRTLAKSGYDLSQELAAAVDLVARAKAHDADLYKEGVPVSPFGRQAGLFDEEYGDSRVTDAIVLLLSDLLNSGKPSDLRKVLATYNNDAASFAAGQMDMFSGDVTSKEDLLKNVLNYFRNATPREQQAIVDAAIAERKQRAKASEQVGDTAGRSGEAKDTGEHSLSSQNTEPKQTITLHDPRTMSDEEKERRGEMLRDAYAIDVAEGQIVATVDMSARKAAEKWWNENVPESVFYDTEAGEVEINKTSIEDSLAHRYGQAKLDAITSLVDGFENAVYLGTLPDFVRQEGVNNHYFAFPINYKGERSYVFCRAMQDANKNRLYVHEVFVADKIKKGNTLQTAAFQPHGGIALYRDILANVLDRSTSKEIWSASEVQNDNSAVASDGLQSEPIADNGSTSNGIPSKNEEYNRHATVKQPVEAVETSQGTEQNDTQEPSRMNVPTSSGSKVTNNTDAKQENEEKSADSVEDKPLSAKIDAASAEVNTNPTEAQKEAGNYKKGHVQVGTFDITIEQPQGSVRKGKDADGKEWESKMNNTYGYIRGAVGVDGDHIDVFLSNDIDGWNGRKVYVVDQYNPDGSFDEHKVMLGFNDQDEAKGDYLANYENGWEDGRRIDVTAVNLEDFEKWIESSKRKTKPFGEYASVKKDVVEINTPRAGYTITPATYTNKKGKTSNVSLLTFDHDLTADQERAVKEFAKERTGKGRFAPARGWKDRESGGWMFRSEEDARKAAEMVGNDEAVADNQPMTAQELRDAVEPKKPTTSKKTASKKPANRVESVPTEEPIEPEKPKYEVSDEEMNGLMNDIRDILGIGDDEGDAGLKFRDPDELTAEQRQKLMSVGQRLAMAMVERGHESFGDYAMMMVKALGDKVRPWLKAFYGGLEYVPGYDKYALTPYEEVKAFDVENFDKPNKDVMAQANMIVEEDKAQVAAEKANNELKATRNEQRKETEKQTAANTDAVAAEAESVASEATALAETSSDEQELTESAEHVDEALDKVNEQLALLGYYEADEVEKDYNEAMGYMRNAEKKAVKDAANLASQLIEDLGLDSYEATHSKQTDKKGNRKRKPLAVANIAPVGGDVSIHLPLAEGRELYVNIQLVPSAGKGVTNFGGDNLEVTGIMFRVDNPDGAGNDRLGRNEWVDNDVTYSELLKQVEREAYKYIPERTEVAEGEYKVGDKVEYSADGGHTWSDAVVAQPNDDGGIRIDTGLAPYMWVNAHPDQLRHKAKAGTISDAELVKRITEHPLFKELVDDNPDAQAARTLLGEKIMTDVRLSLRKDGYVDTYKKLLGDNDFSDKIADKAFAKRKIEPKTDVVGNFYEDIVAITDAMKANAMVAPTVEINDANWKESVDTPIGSVKMGENQKAKLFAKGREMQYGMLLETLSNPDVVLEEKDKEQNMLHERPSSYLFVKTFQKEDGSKYVHFESVTVSQEGMEVSVSSHIIRENQLKNKLKSDRLLYKATALDAPANTSAEQPIVGGSLSSVGKDTTKVAEKQGKGKKKVKPGQQVGDLFAGLLDEPNNNGLQGNDDAVRAQGVQADGGGQQQGPGEGQGGTRKAAAQEGGRPDGGRGGQSTGKDRAVSAGLHGLTQPKNTRNNHSERGADHAPTSVNGRIEANIKAIELAHELLESGETATPEQMSVLRQFSGWGGLGAAFKSGGYDWKQKERNKKIRELLGGEAYDQAVMSANSAYYTPAYVVDTLWDIAKQLGFKGGNILEGSAGIGNILGQMPMTMSERSDIHAIEIDGTSGGILSLLYPDAKVDIQGFEQTRIPNGSVDLAITNVPFVTGLRVNDTTGDSDLSKKFHNIHDFCIAKNVRKLREGGLGIFISSNGTLDGSKALRDWVVNDGGSDFIGAFRMNNKTFGGTTVTSDIIVIRKRVNGVKSAQAIDVSSISGERTAEYEEPGARKAKQLSMDYNKYFLEHPDHMAGEMRFAFEEGDTFRPTSKGLYPVSGKDQGKMLADFVKSFTEEERSSVATTDDHDVSLVLDASADGKKLGEMYMKDGRIVLASFGGYYPLEVNDKKIKGHTKQECFTAYAAIKTALADVMKYQTENEDNAGLEPLIEKLNKAYDDFVNTYGHLNKNNQLAWLRNDVDYPNVFSLETYSEQGDGKGGVLKTYGKADVMKGRVVEKESEPHPENVKDGVVVSMFKNGRIDVPYIAGQLGKSEAEVKREIVESGLGFEDPTTRQMEVSYKYLSGNVREKLKQAEANNENGEYSKNIKALQEVVPMNIPSHLIDFTLGSSWLDPKLYGEYAKERTDIDAHFTAAGGTWFMKAPRYGVDVEKNRAMGIVSEMLGKTIMGHELIEAAIQNKSVIVSRTEKHSDGTTETITDREATAACAAKIDEIRQDFKDWMREKMQGDADLSARMEQEYNDRFNNYVPMSIPDEFVPEYFGGAAHKFKMRPHQGKAIVRGTMQPLLLAHEVGTGKTFTLISTAMEMRRLGTARKPMIVVQNATVGQFAASAKELYPNAKILTLEDNDRNSEGRKNFYAKIKYNDWDMIVVPQSTFEFIPDSDERKMQFVQDKIDEKMLVLEQMRESDSSGRNAITRRAEKELADLQAELAALTDNASKKRTANDEKKKAVAKQNAAVKAQEMLNRRTDDVENFDDMGIDALLIDEAHEYKHLGFATAMQRGVKGVDPSYSKKSQGVYLKTQAVLEKNNGRNVVFATGTPISNTAAEIWTFMRYLMPKDTMKEYGIYYFDDFVRNFGNIQQMPEFNTSGKFKEVNRFAGYVNLPELVRIWSGVADTVLTKDQTELVKKIPELEGGKAQDIYLPQTRALRSVMKYVRKELERFDEMSGKEKKENSSIPLTMYGIAQGAAVDARLVEMHAEDDPRSKTNEAVRQTLRSLKETDGYKGTVAIFADHYQNKHSGFNLYEDIRKKLVANGVAANEVVVMKPGMTIKKKLEIFEKVNRGEVRVILGSTATLGTGVNIQERLHTLIHLDAPNRPMDYTQRNGRILRQGNLHKKWGKPVRVLRFGVEDSLDVTAYQRLKTKGAIADSVMEGDRLMRDSMNNRVLEEEEDVFGDTVAQLSGSEYALLKNNAEKNVRKYESRKKQWKADQAYIHYAKPRIEGQIKANEKRADEANKLLLAVQRAFPDGKFNEITVGKHKFGSVDDMADFIKDHNKKILDAVKAMKENPTNEIQTNTVTLSLGGFDFVVKTEMVHDTLSKDGLLFAEIHRIMTYSCPELGLNDVPVKQSLLRNAIEDITENVITGKDFAERFDTASRLMQHQKSELELLKQREGKPFEYEKELEEAERQLEEYSEAMMAEMAEKEKKYAEMDANVKAATDVVVDEDDESEEDKTKFRLLDEDDPKAMELESLPESELVPVYRNVQAFEDDALGSPMAFTDAETGERRTLEGRRWNYSAPPKVELTEEQQRKLDELNKNGYIMIDGKKSTELQINDGLKFVKPKTKDAQLQYFLKKNPEDKGLWAAYDPYDHAIETPLNTQFGEAYKRPNLVVVRSLIPKSEIDEPFQADYALLPTGAHQWNNGRTLYLSRWSKIDKVLTREEEAKLIDEYWKKHPGKREELKSHRDYNRFVPQVRRELEKMGYRFELDGKELTPEESLALDKQNWESRDVIPGREGHTPFISNEDIERINAKMAGKWVGEPKEAMESAMSERVTELSERLHTPVRIIRTEEEVAALPSARQRRMKGSFNPLTGEVTIVVPNNANMADIENTFVHEVVGHDGLRVLFPDEAKLNNALDELYRVSKDEIRGIIDRMAQKMYDAEVDRLREKKRKEHVANGEDANASYYADMAEAHAETSKKREQFRRNATEEYGADLAGRIGESGFEKMSADELTFWGRLKSMLEKALQKLLAGLKIPGKKKWGDKEWAFVLHEAYKRKKNGGRPTVFDAADTEVMRRKTGFDEVMYSDGKKKANEPKPIGRSTFGSVYNQFKGKVLQAVKFLVNHESGDLLGVFHRKDIGDIDMVWGDEGGGLCHILNKHINEKDFPTVKDLVFRIEDIINKGEVDKRHSNADKLVLVKDGYLVTIRRNVRERGIKIADKNWVLTAYNKDAPATTKAPADGTHGSTAVAPGTSSDAKLATKSEINEFSDKNVGDEGVMFRDGDMGLDETITKMKIAASQANADNWQAKQDAIEAIGGNLNKLRQAMARQRAYDLTTVKSVTDLAKVLLERGLLDDLSKYETKRILSAVNNVHGKQDVSDYVQKVMDIMVDNQLRMGANQLGKLLSIRGSRVDARGIEVQGQLDPEGQRIAQVVRKATSLPKENIEERIADCINRMSSDDNAVAEEAAIEYSGLLLAHQFVEDITESKAEEKDLRESIKEAKADLDAGMMETDAYREYVESTNDAIRQNKIERAEAYRSIVEQVGGVLGGSVERAKAWREAEKQRVEAIHHNANSDMTGRPNDEHHKESKAQKIANNSIVRFVLAPLGTFDQMLRMFGNKSVNGEGYLWNRYMRGWVDATEKEYTGYQNALKTLDKKVSDVFGKKMKWGDLFAMERNLPKATVTFWDGGERKAHELTQGNLLYIYMVDKMADGRMKMRKMGITEEDVENIKEFVDPGFLELADWMQEEFLVAKRNEYNEVHKRMFGAPMAAIENYFPLKILANARVEEVDVADDTADIALPATSTGSIIKRRRNNLALDVMGADAFSVILDHVQQMERWAAFAEFNRDLNTLLSYKRFRNQVMNMTSGYGGGKTLWTNFRNVCSMAAGAYRPPIAALDKAAVNVAKGVTAAKVSFRVFTALKQFLSMPAYLSDSSPAHLAGNIVNPIGAWKWSMENLPLFEKRWKSRMAGDPRLMKSEMDWKMWQNHVVEIASRIGMSPNAFVDALTVAIGARSMYETKKDKYLRYGYDEETAEKRAKQDATILFNQTQQSSESAFLSTMQVDRSWLSVLFTVFRNSSMSYTRQLYDALRNLKHRFEPGYKGLTEEYLAKQMRRDGIDPDKADQNAKSEYRRSMLRDIVRVGVFGYLLQIAWNLGAYVPYLIAGDDKDEKSDMWDDAFKHAFFGSIEGLTGGDVMSAMGNDFLKGNGVSLFNASKDMPLSSDIQNIVGKWNKDKVAAMNDVVNLMVQSGIGVNPQSLTDAVVAIMDYCGDDANTSRECALLITRILNCPQSQIDKIYFDELGATAAEAQGMTPAEIAERYARYKTLRGAPLTGWTYSEAARDSVMTAQQNRVLTKAKERVNGRMETEETKKLLSEYESVKKREKALEKLWNTDRDAYRKGMDELRRENVMPRYWRVDRYKHDMKELTERYLRSNNTEERDSIVGTMFRTRDKMLNDVGRLK